MKRSNNNNKKKTACAISLQSFAPVVALYKIKLLWPLQFSVSQLSFSSHQDWILCTRNEIPVSKASCSAGVHLPMAFLCCYTKYWAKNTEAKRKDKQRIIMSGVTEENLKRECDRVMWRKSSGEQLEKDEVQLRQITSGWLRWKSNQSFSHKQNEASKSHHANN